MTSFKSYLRAHLKSNFRPMIYILAIALALTLIIGLNAQPYDEWDRATDTLVRDYHSTLYIPVIFLCILAYVLPVLEFSFFKKRRNLDCAYALPISRRAMGLAHYVTGAVMLISAFTFSYLLNFILLLTRGVEYFNFAPMIAHYFLCVLLGLAMYSVFTFVFNEANTTGDGIWFMLLWTFILSLGLMAVENIADNFRIFNSEYCAIPWGTIDTLTTYYQKAVEMVDYEYDSFWQSGECICWLIFWIVAGVGAAVGSYFTFGKRRMEKTEEVSDSFFGFRVLIPAYAITGMLGFAVVDVVIIWVIIELLALLGYTIYRRGFHYKKSDILILSAMLIFLFLCYIG